MGFDFPTVPDAGSDGNHWGFPQEQRPDNIGSLDEDVYLDGGNGFKADWGLANRLDALIDAHSSDGLTNLVLSAWQPETLIYKHLDLPTIDLGFGFGNFSDLSGANNSPNGIPVQGDNAVSTFEPSSHSHGLYQDDSLEPGFGYEIPTQYHQAQPRISNYTDQYPWAENTDVPVPFVGSQAFATEENGFR